MGHLSGKDLYKRLGKKLDGLTVRVPWNEALYRLIKELYSEDEAALLSKMPYGLSKLDRIARSAGLDEERVKKILDGLCEKGLVMDFWVKDSSRYMISPMVVGIFEYSMMRTGGGIDFKKTAELFREYIQEDCVCRRIHMHRMRSVFRGLCEQIHHAAPAEGAGLSSGRYIRTGDPAKPRAEHPAESHV